MCDNPIQIIGLYKREEDMTTKLYARHSRVSISGLADYHEENYDQCSYHNPSSQRHDIERNPEDFKSNIFYRLTEQHFDLIIEILEKSLGIFLSDAFAKRLLQSWRTNEGWMYYDTNYNNLPFMLLYAEPAYTIFGRMIRKDSQLAKDIQKKGKNFMLLESETFQYYQKVGQKSNTYLDASFYISQHKFEKLEEHITESFLFTVTEDQKVVYEEKIIMQQGLLHQMMERQKEKREREKRLLQIAKDILR